MFVDNLFLKPNQGPSIPSEEVKSQICLTDLDKESHYLDFS